MLSATEIAELNNLRLENDLTYRELAKAIGIATSKAFDVLNTPLKKLRLNDRTAYKVRRFLERERLRASGATA